MPLSCRLRWYPEQMSVHWHGRFNAVYPVQTEYMFIWIFAVPLACFMLHSVITEIVIICCSNSVDLKIPTLCQIQKLVNRDIGETGQDKVILSYRGVYLLREGGLTVYVLQ